MGFLNYLRCIEMNLSEMYCVCVCVCVCGLTITAATIGSQKETVIAGTAETAVTVSADLGTLSVAVGTLINI